MSELMEGVVHLIIPRLMVIVLLFPSLKYLSFSIYCFFLILQNFLLIQGIMFRPVVLSFIKSPEW